MIDQLQKIHEDTSVKVEHHNRQADMHLNLAARADAVKRAAEILMAHLQGETQPSEDLTTTA